jgi:uncharacterized protein YcfL
VLKSRFIPYRKSKKNTGATMKQIAVLVIVVFLMLTGCAAQEEPVSTREPKSIITEDDYEDLKIKTPKKEPAEVDYKKEGEYKQNFDPLQKK